MEPLAPIHVLEPAADPHAALDAGDAALVEIDAAIALVLSGAARRVRLTSLPFVESIAPIGLARARSAGVAFTFERAERVGVATVTLGPIEPHPAGA
ncbi:MAG TPA: hypothetical protein VFJ71_10775 [Candidatus Limnocylindrales bacterium]|nr:hypothetical protein [Candidatus Limnocylindrales bacterium]